MRKALTASKVTSVLFTSLLAITSFNAAAHHESNGTQQAADPLEFTQLTVGRGLVGGAILNRTFKDVRVTVEARGLDNPNTPYTAWWVVFNNPAACTGGAAGGECGPQDLGNADADTAVFHAAGYFSSANSTAGFEAELTSGRIPQGTAVVLNDDDGIGLEKNNGLGAEIHVVIRSHGATVPGSVGTQLTVFNGGCGDFDGDPIDECEDEQVFIFPATGASTSW